MTAGVPGTGIGGLFYLVAAVLLPLRGFIRRLHGGRVSWRLIARKSGLALGVLLGILTTGWLLGLLLGPAAILAEGMRGAGTAVHREHANLVRWVALLAGFGTLAAVLLLTQMARLFFRKKKDDI
jgi:hypothetical protein